MRHHGREWPVVGGGISWHHVSGAVAVPLDTAFNANQVNKLLWDSGAAVIFTDSKHLAWWKTP